LTHYQYTQKNRPKTCLWGWFQPWQPWWTILGNKIPCLLLSTPPPPPKPCSKCCTVR